MLFYWQFLHHITHTHKNQNMTFKRTLNANYNLFYISILLNAKVITLKMKDNISDTYGMNKIHILLKIQPYLIIYNERTCSNNTARWQAKSLVSRFGCTSLQLCLQPGAKLQD